MEPLELQPAVWRGGGWTAESLGDKSQVKEALNAEEGSLFCSLVGSPLSLKHHPEP